MERTFAVFIPMVFFICVVLCIYFIVRYRHETMVKLGGVLPPRTPVKFQWKKIGIIIIGFASGVLITAFSFIWGILSSSAWNGFFVVGIISLCIGISFIIADKIDEKKIDG